MKKIITRFINNPIDYAGLMFLKLFIYPFKYKVGTDYNAEKYWTDRFRKYHLNIKGPGHEGATVEENKIRYEEIIEKFKRICSKNIKNISELNVLEIGVGTGLITKSLSDLGVIYYTGVDITDVLFDDMRNLFPSYQFVKSDITNDKLTGKYDLIVIIDVIEHIVTQEKICSAFENLHDCLLLDGFIVIAPLTDFKRKNQFYEHQWSRADLTPLANYKIVETSEWTKGYSSVMMMQKK